jgi:hypothetical protein
VPEQTDLPIDLTLTPENAADKGFPWICDLFDGMAHDALIISLVQEDGYKLGKAGGNNTIAATGLYRPVREPPGNPPIKSSR